MNYLSSLGTIIITKSYIILLYGFALCSEKDHLENDGGYFLAILMKIKIEISDRFTFFLVISGIHHFKETSTIIRRIIYSESCSFILSSYFKLLNCVTSSQNLLKNFFLISDYCLILYFYLN